MSVCLLVGQAPSRTMSPGDRPFQGTPALARLANYCGESDPEKLYQVFDFINLVDDYPGPSAVGSKWDATPVVSTERQHVLHDAILNHGHVVLLGRAASDVIFGKKSRPPMFSWALMSSVPLVECTWSAHPGGTSMWWNQPKNREAGMKFWSGFYAFAKRSVKP